MGHDHAHPHAPSGGHAHAHSHGSNESRLRQAAVLTAGFMVAEAVGGLVAGSLALVADAGHMLADTASLWLAWFAMRLARRPADLERTFGFHRLQVLAAFINGLVLFFIAIIIIWEAVRRFSEPVDVLAGPMLVIAVIGLLVNVVAFFVLHGAERDNLNIKGAMLHVIGDLLGSAGAIVAALVILWTGWEPIDPLLSVLVTLLILRSAWFLVRESSHILLEATPRGLDIEAMKQDLTSNIEGLVLVHHVHAWSLTQDRPMVTLHACVSDVARARDISQAIKSRLRVGYGVDHVTVEMEPNLPGAGEDGHQ
ncbi:MAG: cation diffusion facilitator family transporter [Hyphomicrobiaceae bacterium]